MRETQFRAKRRDNKEFVYGSLLEIGDQKYIVPNDAGRGYPDEPNCSPLALYNWFEVDPATVGQYTGLKDKNGKDIYDDDVIKNHQADVNVVHWFGNGWHYKNYHAEAISLDDTISVYDWTTTKHEVIGNIHENPELL